MAREKHEDEQRRKTARRRRQRPNSGDKQPFHGQRRAPSIAINTSMWTVHSGRTKGRLPRTKRQRGRDVFAPASSRQNSQEPPFLVQSRVSGCLSETAPQPQLPLCSKSVLPQPDIQLPEESRWSDEGHMGLYLEDSLRSRPASRWVLLPRAREHLLRSQISTPFPTRIPTGLCLPSEPEPVGVNLVSLLIIIPLWGGAV